MKKKRKRNQEWIIVFIVFVVFVVSIMLFFNDYIFWGALLFIISAPLLLFFFLHLADRKKSVSSNDNYYTRGYSNIWLKNRNGYTKYEMVGMYYRKLKRSDMGEFDGYARAEVGNMYDPFAVAICNNNGKHIGYLPAGNSSTHKLILENGGTLPAYGYISCDSTGNNYVGEVGIKTDII